MLRNKICTIVVVILSVVFVSCNRDDSNAAFWGKTNSYDPFLWKSQVPDTLKQTLCFDFNEDAVRYMTSPLKLGVFKKDADGHLCRVNTDEMQLFVNGEPTEENVICVNASDKELEVGIVFNKDAQDKVHYWYIKPIDAAGLERVNDKESYGDDDALMEIKVQKHHVMNPLAKGLMWFGIIILVSLLLWFVVFKYVFFPTFRATRLLLVGPEPYFSQLKIKGYRLCILSDSPKKQSWINQLFTGKIKYEVNPIWTAPVVFIPRDKKTIRIRPDKHTYTADTHLMRANTDYVIVNEKTKNKTTMKIS